MKYRILKAPQEQSKENSRNQEAVRIPQLSNKYLCSFNVENYTNHTIKVQAYNTTVLLNSMHTFTSYILII